MNDRLLTALRAAGFDGRPTATLEKDGAAFALSDDLLFYLGEGGPRQVVLRDISRIHSDNAGVLRIETGAGVAIQASLVGYDVERVQHFFAEVRRTTERAKSMPSSPVAPTSTSSPWKTGWGTASPSVAAGTPPVTPTPAAPTPPAPTRSAPAERPAPIRISSGGAAGAASPATPTPPALTPAAPAFTTFAPAPAPTAPSPAPASLPAREEPAPVAEAPAARPPAPAAESLAAAGAALARFAPTLRLLAVLMGLTGIGVGLFEWRDGNALTGLWTVGVGAVGAFALYVFAGVVRVIALLAGAGR